MKIIDLLNKIANGEEMPEKIAYKYKIYNFDCEDGDYYNNENKEYLLADLFERCYTQDFINNIVEIVEEKKKIPEKIEYYDDSIAWVIDDVGQLSDVDKVIIYKLNDVIDYLKSKGE